jgi:UDP-glucose 4-epimerase
LYDSSPHNLFPVVFRALAAGQVPLINGDDYPTPDGTCVRDYIRVAESWPPATWPRTPDPL